MATCLCEKSVLPTTMSLTKIKSMIASMQQSTLHDSKTSQVPDVFCNRRRHVLSFMLQPCFQRCLADVCYLLYNSRLLMYIMMPPVSHAFFF